ncbi:synaptosomal-associated protein 25-like [Apostichopus japonicus]|uniref:synaptosomal-associated protein 25-like n=1 Tax=Stichopus japonicus TaxID=307972 RepID=UPI003AB2E86E
MSNDDEMRSHLEGLQQKADMVTDQSLDSTRRMLQMAEESQEVGIKTLTELDQQGEKLDRIEGGLDQINSDMKEAERNLSDLEKCCGLCVCPWNKHSSYEKTDNYKKGWKTSEDGKVKTNQPRIDDNRPGAKGDKSYVTRITNDAREDEMDDNLGAVSDIIGNLKNMAVDMGNEIDTQNNQIDRTNQKALANKDRIEAADKRAKDILRNK